MRRRFPRLLVVVSLFVAGCSGDDESADTQPSVAETTTSPADTAPPDPAPPGTDPPLADEALPELEDIVIPEWEPETRTDELAAAIGTDELTTQQAVDAFALLYPDMPGATPSDLPAGPGLDASYTWMLISSVRDRLAPDQQAVVDEADASDEIGTIDADGTLTEAPLAQEEIPLDGVQPGGFMASGTPKKTTYARYARLAQATMRDWRTHRADMPPFSIKISLNRNPIPGGGMQTGPVPQPPGRCLVEVDPGFVRLNSSDALIKFFFAHEFFHCIQFQWNPNMDWRVAKWVFDGSADFAALDVYRNVYAPPRADLSRSWFTSQGKPLASRWYDAWGLFEAQWEEGTDPYPGIKAMVQGVTTSDPTAALALGGMDGLLFRMKWSSRSMRSSRYPAEDWQMSWPGGNPGAGPRENRSIGGTRGVGTYDVTVNGGFVHPQVLINMDGEVGLVDVTMAGGPLTSQSAAGILHVADGSSVRLCFDGGGCVCPDGTVFESVTMSGKEMIFSFAAAATPTTAKVAAQKWDPKKFCKEKAKPKRGSSNGDPHLVSFDGQPFDVMTLGEFVNTRDPAGDFEVQTRHVQVNAVGAAATTAVAIDVGEQRITFTVDGIQVAAEAVVRVDGEETTDTELLLGDVEVLTFPEGATLTWPDGSTVELMYSLGWFVTISPSAERAAVLEGLLGSVDGDFTNDLKMPDGTIVDPVDAGRQDSEYSLAWQVDDASSLFDYEPGESVETFRIPFSGTAAVELSEDALERCASGLGEEATTHEVNSCAYDVTATGAESYVDAYEVVVEERVAAEEGETDLEAEEPPAPAGSVAAPADTGEAALTLSGTLVASFSETSGGDDVVVSLAGSLEAVSGTVLVLRAERCSPDVTLFVGVTQRSSGATSGGFICDPSEIQLGTADEDDEAIPGEVYFWLPADGEYDIVVDTDGEEPTFVSVDAFVDPEPTIVTEEVIEDGHSTTLEGIGDTVVYVTPEAGATLTATGLDVACATEAYGASPLGTDEVWMLAGFCGHDEVAPVPGYDVPLVVFSRTSEPVEIELVPG